MMTSEMKPPKSHFSPKFANKAWASDSGYISYFSCPHSLSVKKKPKARKTWGRKFGLYTWPVEHALDQQLENEASLIYEKIRTYNSVTQEERIIWAQFLLSQLVRTPTFIKYENKAREMFSITDTPLHDRVGCRECLDLNFVVSRDWCLLLAHEDDYFVRSDNPVLQTGFIERPETCLFYPLSPKLCFVACSMPKQWNAFSNTPRETCGYQLEKGGAHSINFYLARAAGDSLIISPEHDGLIAETMYKEILGMYPQPPFSLHNLGPKSEEDFAYESIRVIMGESDNTAYPLWRPFELEPNYQTRNGAGVA
jgi:hypothetical protein